MKTSAIVLLFIIGLASCNQQSNQETVEENQSNEDSIVENPQIEMVSEKLAGNNFAILWETEDNLALLEWDKSVLRGARWGGEMVMFFTAEGDAFGHAIGYDMDTHEFLGNYEIQDTDEGKKIILSGTLQVRIEGMEEIQENKIAEKELLIVTKDGNKHASGFSLLEGVASQVLIMVLSKDEIDEARMAIVDN